MSEYFGMMKAQSMPTEHRKTADTMEPISFEEAKSQGIRAEADSVHHYYGARSSKDDKRFAEYADMAKRFSARGSIERLGRHTGGLCPFCGDRVFALGSSGRWQDRVDYQWDHLIPASKLGLTADGNICPICKDCNQDKSDKDAVAYYEERRAKGLPVLFASTRDMKKFLKSYSKPYRKLYGKKLYQQALNNSIQGATEEQLRRQIGSLHSAVDANGEYVLLMAVKSNERLNTSSADFIERVKTEKLSAFGWSTDTRRSYYRILHKIQYAMDDMVTEGILATADMESVNLDSFYDLANRVYGEAWTLSQNQTRIGEAKKLLAIVASYSSNFAVRAAAKSLPTYALYRDSAALNQPRAISELRALRATR